MAHLRKLCKERELTLRKGPAKVGYQIPLRAGEEVCLLQATIHDQEDHNEDNENEEDKERENSVLLAPGTVEEEDLLIGMRSPALADAINCALSASLTP
ncbi:hypothetical protein NDU88_002802 [Pleurodeles waltl]|uniref:Uncharacterized protein n=1 Tax=Pleurodeles waltl TaxID=8319 RepID=A0AAV7TLR2_PLEWA|nr:hypothetical protein NDU88_002802 [Pleurodeles waltl]